MDEFDFNSPAEIFASPGRNPKRHRLTYRRFDTAAEAICFAMEELSPALLVGTALEVCEERFDGQQIRELYEREDFPLPRRSDPLPGGTRGRRVDPA